MLLLLPSFDPAVGVSNYAGSVANTRGRNPHLKASAAGFSYSMLHLVSATPALCMPQLRPPQPAKMSMVASFAAPLQTGMAQLKLMAYELCWRLLESSGDAKHCACLQVRPQLLHQKSLIYA